MDQLLLRRLWWLGFLGFAFVVEPELGWTRWLLLLFLLPIAADVLWVAARAGSAERAGAPGLPLPGPAAQRGRHVFALRCALSDALALLHPRQRRQVMRRARGERRMRERVGDWAPARDGWTPKVDYDLPFEGEWYVAGCCGDEDDEPDAWSLRAARHAVDLVVVGVDGRTHAGDGSRLEHYHAYGRPVLAPADGQVVEVVTGVRDAPRVGTGWLDWAAPEIGGNSVTIRHAEGEFSHLAHLADGSVTVRAGEWVRRGQPVGRCGNSGHSTEPHLRFQLQDHPDCYQAVGLPVPFCRVRVPGERIPRTLHLAQGMRVSPVTREPAPAPLLSALPGREA